MPSSWGGRQQLLQRHEGLERVRLRDDPIRAADGGVAVAGLAAGRVGRLAGGHRRAPLPRKHTRLGDAIQSCREICNLGIICHHVVWAQDFQMLGRVVSNQLPVHPDSELESF